MRSKIDNVDNLFYDIKEYLENKFDCVVSPLMVIKDRNELKLIISEKTENGLVEKFDITINDKNENFNCCVCGVMCKCVVGVVASDNDDFLNWKDVDAGFNDSQLIKQRAFIDNDVLYYGITKPLHIHSITFDEIIETKNAKENTEYDRIMYAIKPTLRHR